MFRLIDRNRQVPGGLKFYIPALKWTSTPWASFETIVQAIIAARRANPHLTQQHGWATDHDAVANELDAFNAEIAAKMGWTEFYTGSGGGATAPFTQTPQHASPSLRKLVAGAKVLVEWIGSKEEAVSSEQANKRAWICAEREDGKGCPLNGKGDWTKIFTVPAAEAIRAALNQRSGWNLSTKHDEKLGSCNACDCPMKLKVHMPLARIISKMPPEDRANLDQRCWITQEALSK